MANSQYQIILGSQSPRRRELMAGLDLPFTAINIDADETYPADLQGADIPYYISRAKARAYETKLLPNQLLITADTIVWLDGKMLGKPHDADDAFAMLRALSGKTHQVYTAVTFAEKSQEPRAKSQEPRANSQELRAKSQELRANSQSLVLSTIVDKTDVTFAELTDEEIRYYIDKYKPYDKAGAYGVQEWIGYIACTQMKGSYFNVMGFPVHRVYEYFKSHGVL